MDSSKHFYLGGNTPYGFFSYYDNVISQIEAKRIYCIKGGPGTGKSSFMKQIAEKMQKSGYEVEKMHCSSDNNSLDGILIKKLNIAFLDGTSPHIVDPKNPGAVDEIINLGSFWNREQIEKNKANIITANKAIGASFKRAYKYLAAARCLYDDMNVINERAYDVYERNMYVENVLNTELSKYSLSPVIGTERKLFATAVTPNGVIGFLESIFDGYKVNVLRGYTGDVLNQIAKYAMDRGFDVEKYYCAMCPDTKCEHLLIPKLNLAFSTENEFHSYSSAKVYEFAKKPYQEEAFLYDYELYKQLINSAVNAIHHSKEMHDELEKNYIPNMNFKKIQTLCDKTIKQILEMK